MRRKYNEREEGKNIFITIFFIRSIIYFMIVSSTLQLFVIFFTPHHNSTASFKKILQKKIYKNKNNVKKYENKNNGSKSWREKREISKLKGSSEKKFFLPSSAQVNNGMRWKREEKKRIEISTIQQHQQQREDVIMKKKI